MPLECVWLEEAPPDEPWRPGWCFYAPFEYDLSKHYLENVKPHRRPIMVMLPVRDAELPEHGTNFIIDSHPTGDPEGSWTVDVVGPLEVGEKPDITVSPSIDCKGLYHGFLQHGVLTDDLG